VAHPRLLLREHCRIVQSNGATSSLNMLYPYPRAGAAVPARTPVREQAAE